MMIIRIWSTLILFGFLDLARAAHSRRRVVVNGAAELVYDRSITTFDPSGRLLQVEYGMEAARRGGSIAAALTNDGNILVLVPSGASTQKVHRIDEHLWLFTAGLSGDARLPGSHLRMKNREHRLNYGEPMTVEEAAEEAASVQHEITRTAGASPLGCTAIVLGMDPTYKETGTPRMFRTDPGGILEDCLYCCAGKDQAQGVVALEERYESIRSSSPVDAIRSFLATQLDQSYDEEASYDLWLLTPQAGRRGKT